jgi:mannan endo-1,4-beta-mannosidase
VRNEIISNRAIFYLVSMMLLSGSVGCDATSVPTATTTPIQTSELSTSPTIHLTPTNTPTPTLKPPAYTRAQVLEFITSLSFATTFRGAISGQNAYHGDEITDESYQRGYRTMIEALHDKSGEWPGIIGIDYEFVRSFTPAQLSKANKVLIDYARNGGIVLLAFNPQNPWFNDETNLAGNPGTWDGPSATTSKLPPGASLDDLLNPEKSVHTAWMHKLERIAGALQELRDAGVAVLFSPMQEMNCSWYWWGISSHPSDPESYIRVYRAMHDYFTNEKDLDNLIWLYSPSSTYGNNTRTSPIFRAVDWAYPGDAYVDIIAGTNYSDDMSIADYPTYIKMGKPLGNAGFGPVTDGSYAKNGTWDLSRIIERIKNDYPRIAFWESWHSYPGSCWSMISNLNADILLADPLVINRDDLPWNNR